MRSGRTLPRTLRGAMPSAAWWTLGGRVRRGLPGLGKGLGRLRRAAVGKRRSRAGGILLSSDSNAYPQIFDVEGGAAVHRLSSAPTCGVGPSLNSFVPRDEASGTSIAKKATGALLGGGPSRNPYGALWPLRSVGPDLLRSGPVAHISDLWLKSNWVFVISAASSVNSHSSMYRRKRPSTTTEFSR